MKLLVILLISFSGIAQNEVAYEFASYQNKDITKSNVPIVKVHHYMKIYTTGKVEAINKDGKCSTHYLDSRLTNQLNTATAKGLEEFRNKMTLPENHFYAGFYSYLKMGEETVCFNPYNVEGQLKKALKDIENSIEEEKTNVRSNCSFPTNLAQSIRDTHSKSNLLPNSSPPTMVEIIFDGKDSMIMEIVKVSRYELIYDYCKDSIVGHFAKTYTWSEGKIEKVKSSLVYETERQYMYNTVYQKEKKGDLEIIYDYFSTLSDQEMIQFKLDSRENIVNGIIWRITQKCEQSIN